MTIRTCSFVAGTLAAFAILTSAGAQGLISPFTEEAVERGLIYTIQPWNGPTAQFQGFGCAIADISGNGHQDIIVLGNGSGEVGLFENDGTGHFIDRSQLSGMPTLSKPSGLALADYNGDGMLDVYITQQTHMPNYLMRSVGNFQFEDVTEESGTGNDGYGEGASWGDFDNNGWLDLYVVNYTFPSMVSDPDRRNQLFQNTGDGTFDSVAVPMGVDDHGLGFIAVWTDMNRDGWVDLHLVNDRGHLPPSFRGNQLWRNDRGTFTNISEPSGAGLGLWSMGVATGDFTGNGYPDFYITNLPNIGGYNGVNPFLINQGDETFVDITYEAGTHHFIFSWAAMFFDFDNNGLLDLYVCNQAPANTLYGNWGSLPLVNLPQAAGAGGSAGQSFNAAYGDIDGDGGLDLLLNNYGTNGQHRNVQLFINKEGRKRNWIRYNVVGTDGNLHAIGANIDTRTGNTWQWREIYAGGNNMKSQNELVFHVGLGHSTYADEIVVNWPGGKLTRTLTNYPAKHVWTIYPPHMLGDSNTDGVIDTADMLALLLAWGEIRPGAELADMNSDGMIDVVDLAMLLELWSSSTSAAQASPRTALNCERK